MKLVERLMGERGPESVVPSSGLTQTLTLAAAAAMAFLAVFVGAIAGGADRLGESWTEALANTASVRLVAEPEMADEMAAVISQVLAETPGIATAQQIGPDEQRALLQPWIGEGLPLDLVQLPVLFEVTLTEEGPDAEDLSRRLSEAAPGAIYDDHGQFRAPVALAAGRLSLLSALSLTLIGVITAAIIVLAASASLAANAQVIDVLRLVGADDTYITRVFVRRFALRAASGAAVGSLVGVAAVFLMPGADGIQGFMRIGFTGAGWLWPFLVPVLAAAIAYVATRYATMRRLREVS